MVAKTGNIYISGAMTDRIEIPTANLGLQENVLRRLRQRSTTGNGNIDVLGANIAISVCPLLPQSLGCTSIEFVMVENAGCAARISTLSVIVPEI